MTIYKFVATASVLFSTLIAFGAGSGHAEQQKEFLDSRTVGDGVWQRDVRQGVSVKPAAHLGVDLVREGDRISGTVDLTGSPLADRGVVSGTVRGGHVRGTIHSEAGDSIASFSGTVTDDGMSGSYRDRTGETGTWSWSEP